MEIVTRKKKTIQAVIWDYDCTLADTWEKNLIVTRKIVGGVIGRDITQIPALCSLDNYCIAAIRSNNWRTFYREECGLTEIQTDQAGSLWTEVQLQDTTPVRFFRGIPEVLAAFQDLPQGVVSQNSKQSIMSVLQAGELLGYFGCIIGYEEVAFDKQKPAPDALLLCIQDLIDTTTAGYVLYIGDHEVDMACVFHANQVLKQQKRSLQVLGIGAFYGCDRDDADWSFKPDYTVRNTREIIEIVQSLCSG
jgi:HAD superfamily hydrolase (TIGR01549 family)